jgi:hypothetical protein
MSSRGALQTNNPTRYVITAGATVTNKTCLETGLPLTSFSLPLSLSGQKAGFEPRSWDYEFLLFGRLVQFRLECTLYRF